MAAAAGVKVAKHGNRSASSKTGSADVLEALGINLNATPEKVQAAVGEVGITFLFAPGWHPALKAIATLRKTLKVRTVFNLLVPASKSHAADRANYWCERSAFTRGDCSSFIPIGMSASDRSFMDANV